VPRASPSPHCAPEDRRFMRATAFALEFPENRENNREFAIFSVVLAIIDVISRSNSSILHANSLRIGTGNVLRQNGELIGRNRE
jgi:hypothetical protein